MEEIENASRIPTLKRIKNILDPMIDPIIDITNENTKNLTDKNYKLTSNEVLSRNQGENEIKNNPISVFINPCLGDPSNRTVSSGSFMSEKAFLSATEFFVKSIDESYQKAGPRIHIAIKPSDTVIAISTSGGLCPGLNVVIREIVMSAWYNYGVRKIYGIKWGCEGAISLENWIELTPEKVRDIHREGGTILGTCRCQIDEEKIVDNLIEKGVNVYFSIGGDGTHKGLKKIGEEIQKRNEKLLLQEFQKQLTMIFH